MKKSCFSVLSDNQKYLLCISTFFDRPTEPYSENESAFDWANLTRYAEDNLQKAYNFGYDECYHISMDIIKNLTDCIRFLNSNRNTELSDVDEFLKNAEKFIEVGK